MLTADDLKEIGIYMTRKMEKTVSKIQTERNAKIVNYKIRAFIESVRDKLKRFEPISLVDHQQTVINKASQLDRIELTIGQVLNTVQKLSNQEVSPIAAELKSQASVTNFDEIAQREHKQQRSADEHQPQVNTAQKMQDTLEMQKVTIQDLKREINESSSNVDGPPEVPERGQHHRVSDFAAQENHNQAPTLVKQPSKVFRQVELEQSLGDHQKIKQPLDEAPAQKHHRKQQPEEEKHFKSSLRTQGELNATSEADFKRFDSRSRDQIQKLRKMIDQHGLQYVENIEVIEDTFYTGYVDKKGKKCAYGVQNWPDGTKYEGEWFSNQANGKGQLWCPNGDTYEGDWSGDQANGFGAFKSQDGKKRYVGEWKDDLYHGQGVESWADGSRFDGRFSQGKKNGFGTYFWPDGTFYSGNWVNNKMQGTGTYKWLDGRQFEGEWFASNMNGRGKYTWPDGRVYEGDYLNDQRHGNGTFTWPDGRQYQGQWERGKMHGKGLFSDQDKQQIHGVWFEGQRTLLMNREQQ